jgi:hypothetical protein
MGVAHAVMTIVCLAPGVIAMALGTAVKCLAITAPIGAGGGVRPALCGRHK